MAIATRLITIGTTGNGNAIRIMSSAALKRLQNAPDARRRKGHRDALILGLLSHGLRPIEVARLKLEHVQHEDGRLRLRFVGAKNGVLRTVSLTPRTARLVSRWTERTEPRLFLFPRRDTHISTRTIERLVKRWGEEIGVGSIHPYVLRHTVGTQLTRRSNDLWATSRFLGNSPQVCHAYYSAFLTRDADRMADLLAARAS